MADGEAGRALSPQPIASRSKLKVVAPKMRKAATLKRVAAQIDLGLQSDTVPRWVVLHLKDDDTRERVKSFYTEVDTEISAAVAGVLAEQDE